MKLAFVTNIRAPYRILQFNEFSKIKNIKLTAYYTHKESENRKWESKKSIGYKEVYLDGINLLKNDSGCINKGLYKLIKDNDVVILGGYEQPTYILISILCKIMKKPYILSYDGISTNRLEDKENFFKKKAKSIVINNANYILGNGLVSKKYFNEIFGYPIEKIFNQYLTVDGEKINELYSIRNIYREEYRKKYNIDDSEKVLIYSGRLIELKNIDSVVKAISNLKKSNLTLLIVGGGPLEDSIKALAEKLRVKVIITGFITSQETLFKHYFAGDCFILASSTYEVWGLAVNEAMFAGLPVLVSKICGCSLDLVKDNGYIFDPYNIKDIEVKLEKILYRDNLEQMGLESKKIISEWTFKNSARNLTEILKRI